MPTYGLYLSTLVHEFSGIYVRKLSYLFIDSLKNTYEEIVFIKEYMEKNNFKSVIIIAEPPHSRRILLFTKIFGVGGEFEFSVVGSRFDWDASKWYLYPHMRAYVFSEVTKLFYNIFLYGVLDSVGWKESFESYFKDYLKNGRNTINSKQ